MKGFLFACISDTNKGGSLESIDIIFSFGKEGGVSERANGKEFRARVEGGGEIRKNQDFQER